MAQVPLLGMYKFDDHTRALQAEAISEVLTVAPGEKRTGLGSYGLPPPCRTLANSVRRGMGPALELWASNADVAISDLVKPYYRPEAFRLQKGCSIWSAPGHVTLLMPLTRVPVKMYVIPRGSNRPVPSVWNPGMVLFLNELGIQVYGTGSVRFVYILLRKDAIVQPQQ
ncbi:hypothetical protein N0V84_008769 [Fusarium piperis]|uniref:Uncharacterized protein n=1 Tax=Fusarium piperis TaxID=1435070 RepID=A0A9W8W7L1_9HYPO|nr:hypothetical protein N0V84_008769 [Fusarium piperis]